jgi:hypothetical protein
VRRRDVREQRRPHDFVIWFCAREDQKVRGCWQYFFIGYATVKHVLSRRQLWSDPQFSAHTKFYNVLAKPVGGRLVQHEVFYERHDDWDNRATAGYIIFDPSPLATAINVVNPRLVAEKATGARFERWLSRSDPRVNEIENAIFKQLGLQRRLRTANPQQPHRHIALHKASSLSPSGHARALIELRERLSGLVQREWQQSPGVSEGAPSGHMLDSSGDLASVRFARKRGACQLRTRASGGVTGDAGDEDLPADGSARWAKTGLDRT